MDIQQIKTEQRQKEAVIEFQERAISTQNTVSLIKWFESIEVNEKNKIISFIHESLHMPINIYQQGNSNFRIDADLDYSDTTYLFEFEFGTTDSLNTYRRLLDALAIRATNDELNVSDLVPIIVFDIFPNKRSDFWQVLKDINEVLNIEFKVLTFAELMVIYKNKLTASEYLELVNHSNVYNVLNGSVEDKFIQLGGEKMVAGYTTIAK
ncbi:hypothetical protein C6P08_06775 [Weissella confusa]|uniref:hypothetical protein n=1 Tax=Weissella TaxID=46255 RepID=UPI001092DD9E|nr:MULTISPECIES: hypothetical protein [Weissella]MBJ7694266.1 hypothetical protein [Weissella confusa]NFA01872.1 hypothetical protein [Weissella cibaria]QBZ04901.1 hypothetical protein C6P08_06775 [Weissella confusa]